MRQTGRDGLLRLMTRVRRGVPLECAEVLDRIFIHNKESVGFRCRVAGTILRLSRPAQNRTCELPRIRLKHLPARRASAASVSVLDGASGGRERGRGSVGVGGAPSGDRDEACAKAALNAVAAQLK
jgi:hypothetical protein